MIARICVGFLLDPWQMRPGMSNRSQALTTVCFREIGLTEVKRVYFRPYFYTGGNLRKSRTTVKSGGTNNGTDRRLESGPASEPESPVQDARFPGALK